MSTELQPIRPKGFWERPEGITGGLFMAALVLGGGFLLYQALPTLIALAQNTLYRALVFSIACSLDFDIFFLKTLAKTYFLAGKKTGRYGKANQCDTGLFSARRQGQ